MNHLFIPYELAVKLKNVGFYEPVIAGYDVDDKKLISIVNEEGILSGVKTESLLTVIAAPLYQQVVDWFRDKHGYNLEAGSIFNKTVDPNCMYYYPTINSCNEDFEDGFDVEDMCSDYYDAINAAIEKAIQLMSIN